MPAIIFLPANPNPVKAARIRDLGATLIETGTDLSAAIDAAREHASSRSEAFFLHDAEDPDIPAGTAAIGREVVSQLPSVEAIYVPMGDTALIRGVASAAKKLRPSIRIIGVVAEQAPAYYLSWQKARRLKPTPRTPSRTASPCGARSRRTSPPFVSWWTRSRP